MALTNLDKSCLARKKLQLKKQNACYCKPRTTYLSSLMRPRTATSRFLLSTVTRLSVKENGKIIVVVVYLKRTPVKADAWKQLLLKFITHFYADLQCNSFKTWTWMQWISVAFRHPKGLHFRCTTPLSGATWTPPSVLGVYDWQGWPSSW